MSKTYDVIVIGAGHNGLTTAAMLAKQGRKVLCLERSKVVGGLAASREFHPGFKSAGVLHDTTGLRRTVMDVLQLERHGLRVAKEHEPTFVPQLSSEGKGLLLEHDARKATAELVEHSSKDAASYLQYREFIERIAPVVSRLIDNKPPKALIGNFALDLSLLKTVFSLRLLGRDDMNEVLRIGPMCVADWLNEWFESNPVKVALCFPSIEASFTGPWSPGTNANLILREAMKRKPIEGGAHRVIDALEKAARSYGVEIRTDAEVSNIRLVDDRAAGVRLLSGEDIDAKFIASSCDPKTTFLKLVSGRDSTLQMDHQVRNIRARGTTSHMMLAIKGELEFACRPGKHFSHIRIARDLDDMERAFDAVKYGQFSENPILDVTVPSMQDKALAPEGHHVVSVSAQFAPYELKASWSDEQRKALGETILSRLESYAPNIRSQVVASEVMTPVDLEATFGTTGGHLHHGEHTIDQFLTRPTGALSQYKTPIAGLYLCGSGSHPGGGITGGPGLLAATALLFD